METVTATINNISSVIDAINGLVPKLGILGLSISGLAAWMASVWPQPEPGDKLSTLHKWVNNIGANVGYAKNQTSNPQ